MVRTESAKIMSPEEIRDFIEDDDYDSVTVDKLVFIETRAVGDQPGKIFPCYPYAWREEENDKGEAKLTFMADIIQFAFGEFGFIQVKLNEDEFGKTKRIWDKPPTKRLRDEMPFLEEGVQ